MVPLCDPSFFALGDRPLWALRPERGLASARRIAVLQGRSWRFRRAARPVVASSSPAAGFASGQDALRAALAYGWGGSV